MISEKLAGRRIAITGSTGFLGTALVERLLRCAPNCELVWSYVQAGGAQAGG
ncbi:MAG: SDR family oxidoreductase [Actinomycetota bacterium]|nr:SDR family oxidoreductase [Actinomycetota bacterium]